MRFSVADTGQLLARHMYKAPTAHLLWQRLQTSPTGSHTNQAALRSTRTPRAGCRRPCTRIPPAWRRPCLGALDVQTGGVHAVDDAVLALDPLLRGDAGHVIIGHGVAVCEQGHKDTVVQYLLPRCIISTVTVGSCSTHPVSMAGSLIWADAAVAVSYHSWLSVRPSLQVYVMTLVPGRGQRP